MESEFVINIDTGVITFRNEENDKHVNCRPIRKEHALMVERGEIEVTQLIAAIKKHIAENEDFDFDKYAAERRKLNVRKSALSAETVKDQLADRSGELLSDEEIDAAKRGEEAKADPVVAAVKESGRVAAPRVSEQRNRAVPSSARQMPSSGMPV